MLLYPSFRQGMPESRLQGRTDSTHPKKTSCLAGSIHAAPMLRIHANWMPATRSVGATGMLPASAGCAHSIHAGMTITFVMVISIRRLSGKPFDLFDRALEFLLPVVGAMTQKSIRKRMVIPNRSSFSTSEPIPKRIAEHSKVIQDRSRVEYPTQSLLLAPS
jgi:hypothetical protein